MNCLSLGKKSTGPKPEKLRLETLTEVAKSLTVRGEGTPGYETSSTKFVLPAVPSPEPAVPTPELGRVKPLGASLCQMRDEEPRFVPSEERQTVSMELQSFNREQQELSQELHSVLTAFPGVVLEDSSSSPEYG